MVEIQEKTFILSQFRTSIEAYGHLPVVEAAKKQLDLLVCACAYVYHLEPVVKLAMSDPLSGRNPLQNVPEL